MYTLDEKTIQNLLEECPDQRKTEVQYMALENWVECNHRGTFEGATGVGKTLVGINAVAYQFKKNPQSLIYIVVPTTTLRDVDWPAEFKRWGHADLIKKVRIICYASLLKEKPKKDVDLLILDEIHHLTLDASLFLSESNPWKIWNILGLTATLPNPKRSIEDFDKRARIERFAPSIFKVSLEKAIQLELVADFEVKVLKFDLDSTDKYIPGGTKAVPFNTTERATYQYLTKMIQRMVMAKKEGAKFAYIGKRTRFLRNLRSKLWVAQECMKHMITPDNRTLIFCGGIEQSHTLCGDWVYHSQTTDKHLQKFQDKEIHFLGVVDALNEGKNIAELDQSLVVQLDSNERSIIQRIGRNVRFRPGHKALIVVCVAKGTADEKWYESAFENFDKSRIKEYHITAKKPADEPERSNEVSGG